MSCPCYSKFTYKECCQKYHLGKNPENALKLMRSRYSAYALNLVAYIISTTHPDAIPSDLRHWELSIETFCRTTQFNGLDILDFVEEDNSATVSFIARLSSHGNDCSFREKSQFFKVNDRWLYYSGVIFPCKNSLP